MSALPYCQWAEDDDGNWETSCGQAHEFTTGGPKDNRHKFCPYCGKPLYECQTNQERITR